jgi:hypothetical protein
MSERLYSKFYRARQEKAEHGPGTECSACLCKSSYSSEYMNDVVTIRLAVDERCLVSRSGHRAISMSRGRPMAVIWFFSERFVVDS